MTLPMKGVRLYLQHKEENKKRANNTVATGAVTPLHPLRNYCYKKTFININSLLFIAFTLDVMISATTHRVYGVLQFEIETEERITTTKAKKEGDFVSTLSSSVKFQLQKNRWKKLLFSFE